MSKQVKDMKYLDMHRANSTNKFQKNVVHSVHSHDITRFALLILRNGSNKRFFFYAKRKHKTYSSEIACEIQDKYKHLILMRQQKEYNADKRCI